MRRIRDWFTSSWIYPTSLALFTLLVAWMSTGIWSAGALVASRIVLVCFILASSYDATIRRVKRGSARLSHTKGRRQVKRAQREFVDWAIGTGLLTVAGIVVVLIVVR